MDIFGFTVPENVVISFVLFLVAYAVFYAILQASKWLFKTGFREKPGVAVPAAIITIGILALLFQPIFAAMLERLAITWSPFWISVGLIAIGAVAITVKAYTWKRSQDMEERIR